MTVGGANIPVEEPPENEDDGGSGGGGSERGSDEDDGEAQGRRPGASEATPGPLGGGGVDDDEGQTRWKNELRETGCAFLAEGFVYPEDDDNKENYAECVLSLSLPARTASTTGSSADPLFLCRLILAGIKQVDWPGGPTGASVPPEPSSDSDDELHPLDAEGAAQRARTAVAAAAARPPVRPAVQGKPELQLGPSLANAKLGDLPLRVGQPYLFVHQGNNEHIWTLDEVRCVDTVSLARSRPSCSASTDATRAPAATCTRRTLPPSPLRPSTLARTPSCTLSRPTRSRPSSRVRSSRRAAACAASTRASCTRSTTSSPARRPPSCAARALTSCTRSRPTSAARPGTSGTTTRRCRRIRRGRAGRPGGEVGRAKGRRCRTRSARAWRASRSSRSSSSSSFAACSGFSLRRRSASSREAVRVLVFVFRCERLERTTSVRSAVGVLPPVRHIRSREGSVRADIW